MGFYQGPIFCTHCNTFGKVKRTTSGQYFCENCKEFNKTGNFIDESLEMRMRIMNNTSLFSENSMQNTSFIVKYVAKREFMYRDNPAEPNERYRSWLEEKVGKQGKNWNWNICPDNYNTLLIEFDSEECGLLFELSMK